MPTTIAKNQLRQSFFEYLFEDDQGYLCLAVADRGNPDKMKRSFRRIFFEWPLAKNELRAFIDENLGTKHIWFSVHLFSRAKALKENAVGGRLIYADLDACDPNEVEPKPSIATETSPGRFHALWRLNTKIPPDVAADYSRRIAYKYSINGADKSGWDIGQLLRVPYTKNFKYEEHPEIDVVLTERAELTADIFEAIAKPPVELIEVEEDESVPDLEELPNFDNIIYKYANELRAERIIEWHDNEPDEDADWSAIMWRLINTCFEMGMSAEEVFSVAASAKCNKYERDRRPIRLLWKEVVKANQKHVTLAIILEEKLLKMPEIAPEPATTTILDEYRDWATQATDALPIFHELSGFIVLSSMLAGNLRLETSYGSMVPNLWGLILGESTLTRKTTAMTLARNLVAYFDETIEIGSEGSIEGMLQELSRRPRMSSMFYRDEVAGFFEAIARREYLAGMVETMTNLYDSPRVYRRMLKKETVHLENPILLFFGGGVTGEVHSKLSVGHITSGFLPRFLVVAGATDLARLRPTGPSSNENINNRVKVYNRFGDIHQIYNQTQAIKIGNETIHRQPIFNVVLTDDAWTTYQTIEGKLTDAAQNSGISNLALPTFERLSRSCLKMATLLAAARQEPNSDQEITCESHDVINAAAYIQQWGRYSIDLMYNAGKSDSIRALERVRDYVSEHPGVGRAEILRRFHLRKREMDDIQETLLDRGEIRKSRKNGKGGGTVYWPL